MQPLDLLIILLHHIKEKQFSSSSLIVLLQNNENHPLVKRARIYFLEKETGFGKKYKAPCLDLIEAFHHLFGSPKDERIIEEIPFSSGFKLNQENLKKAYQFNPYKGTDVEEEIMKLAQEYLYTN